MSNHILLHEGWNTLSEGQRTGIRSLYRRERRRGNSVNDARYYMNFSIDVLASYNRDNARLRDRVQGR